MSTPTESTEELDQIIADICCSTDSDGVPTCTNIKLCEDCVKDKKRLLAWHTKDKCAEPGCEGSKRFGSIWCYVHYELHWINNLVGAPETEANSEGKPCSSCDLIHRAPLTHELHVALVAEFEKAMKCDDCIYGQYAPHHGIAESIHQQLEAKVADAEDKLALLALSERRMEVYQTWQWATDRGFRIVHVGYITKLCRRFNDLTDQLHMLGYGDYAHYDMDRKTLKPKEVAQLTHPNTLKEGEA